MTADLPEGWANPRTPSVCPECGHFKANHFVPGAKDQRSCAGFNIVGKRVQACDCRVTQTEIERG